MKFSFLAAAMLITTLSFSQNKITETSIEVDGLCGMCEERIENAAYIKGVKKADWDRESHLLFLTFNNQQTSLEQITKSINEAGHDVAEHPATDEQYANIHGCCQYRDAELRASHGLGEPLCTPGETAKQHEDHDPHAGHNHQ